MNKLTCCLMALLLIVALPTLAEGDTVERTRVHSNVIAPEEIVTDPSMPDQDAVHADIQLIRALEGDTAAITAEVLVSPAGAAYRLQWQNDLTGEFVDIPGETGHTIAFPATEENLRCVWRVALTVE